ncbi:hypothetical protein EI94DRAFT_1804547 [Lactarius quietus]|nr:hypothetical protein EI94DRAFT_1804547 [Lactarius quietus]
MSQLTATGWFKKSKKKKNIREIDSFIIRTQESLFGLPRSHPNRLTLVYDLASARLRRYILSDQKEDLDKAIVHLTESILSSPRSWIGHGPGILQALFLLAFALVKRSRVYRMPEDAIHAARYLRCLRDQRHQAFGSPRHQVTGLLVDALAIQMESGAGNVMDNIGEMADLCREILISDVANVNTTRSFPIFFAALLSTLHLPVPEQPMEKVIKCLRSARETRRYRLEARLTLAFCLATRYCRSFVNDDYEEAVSVLDEIMISCSPRDNFVAQAQLIVTVLAMHRSSNHVTPEYSEESTYRARAFLNSSLENQLLRSLASHSLQDATNQRFRYFGGLEASSGNSRLSRTAPPILGLCPGFDQLLKKAEIYKGILYGIRNDVITDIEEAIEVGRTTLPPSAPKDPLASCPFILFSEILFEAFKRTKMIEYLNESISIHRQVLGLPLQPFLRFKMLHELSLYLFTRSRFFPDHHTQDLDEALELLCRCANNKHGSLPDRCWFACRWASIARRTFHPSISTAYKSAVSLMQDTLLFAPTLQLQHTTLAISDDFHRMSLDYASYQVELQQLRKRL